MKKTKILAILLFSVVLVFTAIFSACENNEESSKNNNESSLTSDLNKIGDDNSTSEADNESQESQANQEDVSWIGEGEVKTHLYFSDEQAENYIKKLYAFDGTDEGFIILLEDNILPVGTKVNDYNFSDPEGSIDLSEEFIEGLGGTTGETISFDTLCATIFDYYDLHSLMITVNGEFIDSGHNVYEEPFIYGNYYKNIIGE